MSSGGAYGSCTGTDWQKCDRSELTAEIEELKLWNEIYEGFVAEIPGGQRDLEHWLAESDHPIAEAVQCQWERLLDDEEYARIEKRRQENYA